MKGKHKAPIYKVGCVNFVFRCNSIRKQLYQIPAGTHNETWQLPGYYHAIAIFLQNCRISALMRQASLEMDAKSDSSQGSMWSVVQDI